MKNYKVVHGFWVIFLGVFLFAMPVSGAGGKKYLRIGGAAVLSGPVSETGLAWSRGWELAFDKINEQGGLKIGKDRYFIKLFIEDDKMSAEGGITAATKLVHQNKVKFLLGEIADWITNPIYTVTRPAGVLQVVTYLNKSGDVEGSVADVGPKKPLRIRVHHAGDEVFRPNFEYLVKAYPNVKTVGFTLLDFPGYNAFIPIIEGLAKEFGLKVVGKTERYPIQIQDFHPLWTRLLEYKPDAVYSIVCGITHPGMQLKTARELGFKGPLFYSVPADPILARTIAGPNSTDLFGAALAVDDPTLPPVIKEIKERWLAKYAEDFVSDAVFAYDGAWILAQVIEKAQSVDPQAVLSTFETLSQPGSLQSVFGEARVGGLKTFGANRVLVRPIPISGLKNGKAEVYRYYTPEIP